MAEKLEDGLYAIYFLPPQSDLVDGSEVRGLLRGEHFLGADKFGGVFEGRLVPGGEKGIYRAAGELRVPVGGRLITGGPPATEDVTLEFDVELKGCADGFSGTLEMAGAQVEVRVVRVGDLPT
ncbi:MAG: hypothetical protein RIC14_07095 [Filomicrobium sp.]